MAREVGYKDKPGYIVVRVRMSRGGMKIQRPNSGRRQKHSGSKLISGQVSKADIAVHRVLSIYRNMKVMGTYYLGEDGKHVWYEIVLHDPQEN
jgi:large subunit ribosomal protein L15e